jgi:hypothetical protein
MWPRDSPASLDALADPAAHLGRDHQVAAPHAEPAQRLADQPLALALVVDVGGVEEVDAGVERRAQLAGDGVDAELADHLPEAHCRRGRRSWCRGSLAGAPAQPPST